MNLSTYLNIVTICTLVFLSASYILVITKNFKLGFLSWLIGIFSFVSLSTFKFMQTLNYSTFELPDLITKYFWNPAFCPLVIGLFLLLIYYRDYHFRVRSTEKVTLEIVILLFLVFAWSMFFAFSIEALKDLYVK